MSGSEVFANVPMYDRFGNRQSLAWFQRLWGTHMTGVWPGWTLERIYETDGSLTMIAQFMTAGGAPIGGQPIRWTWQRGGQQWNGHTNSAGNTEWRLGDNEWVAASEDGGADHIKGAYDLYSDSVHLEGLAWAGGTNHAKPNFVFRQGGPTVPPVIPPVDPIPVSTGITKAELDLLDGASRTIAMVVAQVRARGQR